MTKYTPKWALPYPEAADPPRGADQMQALATAVDSALPVPSFASGYGLSTVQVGSGWTRVPLTDIRYASSADWSVSNGDLVIAADGMYDLSALVEYATGPTSFTTLIALNSPTQPGTMIRWMESASRITSGTCPNPLKKGDRLSLYSTTSSPTTVASRWLQAMRNGPIPAGALPGSYEQPPEAYRY